MARYSVERLFERRVWLPLAAALLFGALFAPGCFRERFRPDGFADGADASGIEGDAIFDGEPGDTSNADAEIDQDVQAGDAVDALDDGAQDDVGDSDDSTPVDALPFLFFGSSLGPPPTGTFVSLGLVRVSSAVGQMRAEQAWGGIPLARGENVTDIRRLVVVNPTGHVWLRSQLRVLSRWRTDDQTPESERPIRWLQVTLEAGLQSPGDLFEVELRYYDQPVVPPADFYDVTLTTLGALTVVDTGVARFVLNPWNPALLDEITIRRYPTPEELVLYRHKPGAGPRLRVDGHLIETLAAYDETTSGTSGVFVDPSPSDLSAPDFEIVESGPLRAVVKVRGHFVDPATKIDCSDNGIDDPIDRFGFTAVLTFRRGHSTVDAQFNVRNECGSGLATFTDQGVTIERASWVFPLDFVATQVVGQLTSHDGGSVVLGPNDATYELAQKKGVDDGSGWKRNSVLQPVGGPKPQGKNAEFAETPLLGLWDDQWGVALQMPWMRFREPQSLTAAMTRLEAAIVGDTLRLGEAKAIWGRWRLLFFLVPPLKAAESTEWKLGQLSLERSLVVHRSREKLNGSAVLPYLGGDGVTPLKQQYLEALEQLHPVTGDPSTTPSVWAQTKLFGSQLWPDTTADSTPTVETPFVTPATGNRGCVSCSELLEFFRTGNPSWVWDLALPQSDLLLYSAWYNTDRRPSRYNGFYVGDGTGEGDWHRPSVAPVGATTHNLGIKLAYVLRPSPMVLDRFVAAADAFRLRYDKPREKQNERGPDQRIELASLDGTPSGEILFEHLEMLQNCAEFVPGALGDACLTTVDAVYDELVEENIVAHTACAGDPAPVANCSARSYAMLARIGARVIYRYVTALRPNTATSLALRQMLVESARQLTDVLLPKLTTKNALDLDADWFAAMECTRNGDALESCTTSSDPSDKVDPAWRPALLSLVFIASQLDPTFDRCELMLNTFADLNMYAGWLATLATTPGWDAYSAGMLDAAIFSVGGLDRCQESQ